MEENKMQQADSQEELKKEAPIMDDTKEEMGGEKMEDSSVDEHKAIAIIGYIIPILFFIPLLSEKKDEFAKYHANQHLVLLVSGLVVSFAGALPLIGWFLIAPIGTVLLIICAIAGIINASSGKKKPMPIIGGIKLLN